MRRRELQIEDLKLKKSNCELEPAEDHDRVAAPFFHPLFKSQISNLKLPFMVATVLFAAIVSNTASFAEDQSPARERAIYVPFADLHVLTATAAQAGAVEP